jgi:hypothetical protein
MTRPTYRRQTAYLNYVDLIYNSTIRSSRRLASVNPIHFPHPPSVKFILSNPLQRVFLPKFRVYFRHLTKENSNARLFNVSTSLENNTRKRYDVSYCYGYNAE